MIIIVEREKFRNYIKHTDTVAMASLIILYTGEVATYYKNRYATREELDIPFATSKIPEIVKDFMDKYENRQKD